MNLTVKSLGGVRFEIQSGPHAVTIDQPIEDGGTDAGMTPVELFVGSLASCVGYFVSRYCMRHGLAIDGFTIDVQWTMAEHPHRVGAVELTLHLPAALDPAQREKLLKVAHGCTVHQSLAIPPTVEIKVREAARSTDRPASTPIP